MRSLTPVRSFKALFKIFIVTSLIVFIYCELIQYYVVIQNCDWPKLDPSKEDANSATASEEPVRVMILADTHLLGSRNGHWFDKLRREWQMYRAFQTAVTLLKPELVFVLGDLTDEGLFCGEDEFNYYVKRFHSLFAVTEETKLYVAVGNHDIGFHYRVTPYLNERFVTAFNSPPVQIISLRGNHFVVINSVALEKDGCFLCKPAEEILAKLERLLECSKGTYSGKCDDKMTTYSRPILMQHYPLYRNSDMECNDFDAAPLPIKRELFRENWECLSKKATAQLLNQIKPRLSLSGHTHHGCTRELPTGDGIEINIPSFSWRNKNNPNFGLGVFTPNNYAFVKCEMPKESTVINIYLFSAISFIIFITYYIITRRKPMPIKIH